MIAPEPFANTPLTWMTGPPPATNKYLVIRMYADGQIGWEEMLFCAEEGSCWKERHLSSSYTIDRDLSMQWLNDIVRYDKVPLWVIVQWAPIPGHDYDVPYVSDETPQTTQQLLQPGVE